MFQLKVATNEVNMSWDNSVNRLVTGWTNDSVPGTNFFLAMALALSHPVGLGGCFASAELARA
jgi:hypothetical protein